MMTSSIPEPVLDLLHRLRDKGIAAFVVGGAVRDMCLGRCPEDVDILADAAVDTLKSLFADQHVRVVGNTFPVCLVNDIEVAPCRTPSGRFPEDDLAMRDFTVNAMAYDPLDHRLIDPFNGRSDLENRIIRFTGDPAARIMEDPVRMIRGCRFSALLSARLSESAGKAVQAHARSLVGRIPGERIRNELIKAMALPAPSVFFHCLHDTGLLAGILPSLDWCYGLDGGPFHGETVFEHCLLVGDALPARQPLLRLAGYLHDAGKVDAQGIKDNRITFHGHETRVDALTADLDRLRFSVQEKDYILALVLCHMRPLAEKTRPKSIRRLLAMLAQHRLSFEDFMRMRIADKKANLAKSPYTLADIRLRVEKVRREMARQTAFHPDDLAISGKDIMALRHLGPGPEVGRIKQHLFEKVLDDPDLNDRETLRQMVLDMD
ncbi:MAG: CCA tRNA nucleotidyltransferase [Thermodesulfobacteriota bacterium]